MPNRGWNSTRVNKQNADMIQLNNILWNEIMKYDNIKKYDAWYPKSKCEHYNDFVHSKYLGLVDISAWLHMECSIADVL